MKRIYCIQVCVLIVGLALSMAVGQTRPEEQPEAEEATPDESWNPLSLEDFIPEIKPKNKDYFDTQDLDVLLQGDSLADSTRNDEVVPGFRVQIISTRKEEEAREVRADALASFSENIYLLYDDPYYKLRVGDFTTRMAADSVQKRAIDRGFVGAWIVRTLVHSNPSARHIAEPDSLRPAEPRE